MKRILKKSVAVVSLLMTMAAAYAQMDTTGVVMSDEMGNVVALSLDEAKNHAVAHNRTIKNAALDVKKAEAERWKAIASMLLQVSGEVDYNNMFNHKMSMGAMDISMPSYFEFDITPSFTVSGSQILGVKLANVSKEMSEIAINKTDQSITSNIETSYVGILAQQKTVDLLEKNLANLDSVYKMTLNAVKVGAAEQNDADQISIQVASLKSNVNNLNRMIEVMYNSIRLLTGIPADVDIVLTQPLEEVVNPGSILEIMGTELDMDRNYDYQLQAKMVELNEKQVKLKKMAYVPTLTAYYNFDKKKIYKKLDIKLEGNIAVKVHSGEKGNKYFLKPEFIKPIIDYLDGTIVETNMSGPEKWSERTTNERHQKLLEDHGMSEIESKAQKVESLRNRLAAKGQQMTIRDIVRNIRTIKTVAEAKAIVSIL
mgnify:CR=1 FL=1